jgi:hypothetical protein
MQPSVQYMFLLLCLEVESKGVDSVDIVLMCVVSECELYQIQYSLYDVG